MLKAIFFFAFFCLTPLFSQEYQSIEDQAKIPILTPTFSERQTKKIKLNNDLEVYLVSDPNIDQSSAALIVKAGSWDDPQEYPGIAHFLEHMLFLGTKKYPNESEFGEFVAEHDGKTNAFTSIDFTGYVFSIDSKAFGEALDRFSQFFVQPLFNPSGVARELKAIDQEYAKNIENDDIREYYVYKELSNPEHPNHAFGMGNKDTLAKVSQDVLKQWYREHYSANRMRLVVNSTLPMDELVKMVVEYFKEIPNYHLPQPTINLEMIPQDVKGHIVYIEPLTHVRRLSLVWSLPDKFSEMQEFKPEFIICQMLENGGKGSLLNELKREKLAEEVHCNGSKMGPNNFEFAIEIALTDTGVKEISKVILKCFQAIATLKKTGVPLYYFNELNQTSILAYQYQERKNSYENILNEASWIAQEDISTYPELTHTLQKFDPKLINQLLNYLTPDTCVYSLIAPSSLTKIPYDLKEHWFGTEYTIKAIPAKTMNDWIKASPMSAFSLPVPNPFLPDKLNLTNAKNIKSPSLQIPHPEILFDNESAKIYFSKDLRYFVPKVSWNFRIKTPSIDVSKPESIVLGDLYIKCINEELTDYSFPAKLAGLDFDIDIKNNGISLKIDGYSYKAQYLCLEIIKALKNLQVDEQNFKIYKNYLIRQYQNSLLENPLVQAYDIFKSIVYQEYASNKTKLLAIRKITFEQFEQFASSLLSSTYIEGMLFGNSIKNEAKDLIQQMLTLLANKPYSKNSQLKEAVIELSDKNSNFFESKTKIQGNAAILAIECLPYSFQMKAAQQILMQAMKDPFFTDLRTKQQTGYIVSSQLDEFELHIFNTFMVQSNSHDGRDLLARFELFIENFLQEMDSYISEERFNRIKDALLKSLQQPPKNIAEMGDLLFRIAFKFKADFDWIEKRIQGFKTLTYQDFGTIVRKTMGKGNKRRLGILVKGVVPLENITQYQKICNISQFKKLSSYNSEGNL